MVYREINIASASVIKECYSISILELSQQLRKKERLYFTHNVSETVNVFEIKDKLC